jgi:4a-hydroxytetrahydrobiopterin dehydratase
MATLSDTEVQERLSNAEHWHLDDAGEIEREEKFADFADAVAFVDRVAAVAEEANHHPDILLHGWNKVRLTLSTHSEGGLTDADFRLAARIDELL